MHAGQPGDGPAAGHDPATVGFTLPYYPFMHGTDAPPLNCPHVQTLRDLRVHTEEVRKSTLAFDV